MRPRATLSARPAGPALAPARRTHPPPPHHTETSPVHPVRIDSLDDPRLDDFARLTDVALRRVSEPEGGLYIAESNTVIERAVRAGHVPRSILVQEKWLDSVLPLD